MEWNSRMIMNEMDEAKECYKSLTTSNASICCGFEAVSASGCFVVNVGLLLMGCMSRQASPPALFEVCCLSQPTLLGVRGGSEDTWPLCPSEEGKIRENHSLVPRLSPRPDEKFFVGARGEPGNEAREITHTYSQLTHNTQTHKHKHTTHTHTNANTHTTHTHTHTHTHTNTHNTHTTHAQHTHTHTHTQRVSV